MPFSKNTLSPTEIAKELFSTIGDLPEDEQWIDYFSAGAGRTILELIAGSQSIRNHSNLMRVRESSLLHAKLDSSITQLAANKGVYRPNAKALRLEIVFDSSYDGSVNVGQLLGTYKDYNVFSVEDKIIRLGRNTIEVVVGLVVETKFLIYGDENFTIKNIDFDEIFVGDHFHRLLINGEVVNVVDFQPNFYDEQLPNSVLALPSANSMKLIFGDGEIGRNLKRNDEVEYRCITFGRKALEKFEDTKLTLDDEDMFDVISVTVSRVGTGYLDKEKLRKIAFRSSVDGRWVQTSDYQNGLLKYFGEYFNDIIVKDKYPQEEITFLPKFGYLTDKLKEEVLQMIEDKRGNATTVNSYFLDERDPNNFVDLSFSFKYIGNDEVSVIREIFDKYAKENQLLIANGDKTMSSSDIAVELSKLLPSGKLYADEVKTETIPDLKFIRILNLEFKIL